VTPVSLGIGNCLVSLRVIRPHAAPPKTSARPKLRLVCCPPAGTGGCFFQSWSASLPGVELLAVELPGRNTRLRDELCTNLLTVADELTAALLPLLFCCNILPEHHSSINSSRYSPIPFALLGWSMGAWLAFEVEKRLEKRGLVAVALYAGGSRAPCCSHEDPDPLGARISELPPAEFWSRFEARYGRNPSLDHPTVRAWMLPILKADLGMTEGFGSRYDKISCPLRVFCARGDVRYTKAQISAWRVHAGGIFDEPLWLDAAGPAPHRLSENPSVLLDWLAESLGVKSGRSDMCVN